MQKMQNMLKRITGIREEEIKKIEREKLTSELDLRWREEM